MVFITKRYIDKVKQKSGPIDYCRMEFLYSHRKKSVSRMIPVVLELELRDTTLWTGPVGAILGGELFVDMTTMERFEEAIEELRDRILVKVGEGNRE